MDLRRILSSPALYQKFQVLGGFFGARLKAMDQYLPKLSPGATVFDIGCGPGHTLQYFDQPIDYHGFDVDSTYIEFANRQFGRLGQFHLREFDKTASEKFGKADLVMMHGVVHHLSDEQANRVLLDIRDSLASGGALFTADPCLHEGQHPFAHWMSTHDRGEYVRNVAGYKQLMEAVFPSIEVHVREDLSWVPLTFCITVCRA